MPWHNKGKGRAPSAEERATREVYLDTLTPKKRGYIKQLVLRARSFSPEMSIGSGSKARRKTPAKGTTKER
jgi:hypothetical protein